MCSPSPSPSRAGLVSRRQQRPCASPCGDCPTRPEASRRYRPSPCRGLGAWGAHTPGGDAGAGPQGHKARGAAQAWARGAPRRHDGGGRRRLQRTVVAPRGRDQARQHRAEGQHRLTGPVALPGGQQATGLDGLQGLAEIVHSAAERHQVVQRGSWRMRCRCMADSAQHTGAAFFFNY